jgi:SAM-dependent methyltransferase
LHEYYDKNKDYPAFIEENNKPEFWAPIKKEISEIVAEKGNCKVLEFGAGRTSFPNYIKELRQKICFDAQDITSTNYDYLKNITDNVFQNTVTDITGSYDIIFSTFVWEHIPNPKFVLKHLLSILSPGGRLFIASPCYDFPFYISNSAKHLPLSWKFALSIWLLYRRFRSSYFLEPDFIVHLDPALFHLPFWRDIDAVHWVSTQDIKLSLPDGFIMDRVRIGSRGLKMKFWEKYLIMFAKISKTKGKNK